jgi:hypothetical protein
MTTSDDWTLVDCSVPVVAPPLGALVEKLRRRDRFRLHRHLGYRKIPPVLPQWVQLEHCTRQPEPMRIHATAYDGSLPRWVLHAQ